MNTGLSTNNPAIVTAFHASLLHQGLFVLLVAALVAVCWNVLRSVQFRRASSGAAGSGRPSATLVPPVPAEPVARRLLRVSFGLIWVFDGILQGQASIPLGMVPQVVQPTASASPSWVQHLVNAGTTVWSYHPVSAAAAAVWIQVGIGLWLLAAPRGDWSRLAGAASAGWGVVVWIFGEAFGGIFAPGLSWLFGAPGAVLFYVLAGGLVALPETVWAEPRLGRALLRAMGVFYLGMALLQAWPGRGSWQGQARPSQTPGALTAMVKQMAQTPQPNLLASWVAAFGRFDAAHGWAVNLFVVVCLAVVGGAFISAQPRLVRVAVIAGTVVCLADWVLVQDLGFVGGVGTDPNSMVPIALVFVAGYLAMTRLPRAAAVPAREGATVSPISGSPGSGSWWDRHVPNPTYSFRAIAACGAIVITLIGAVPMAAATTNQRPDPILAQAVDGAPQAIDGRAAGFDLVDQYGKAVSLASLRGKTVVLTFLDDTCTTDCPVIADELRTADSYLGASARDVELVAVNANPRFITPDYLAAFDQQEGLEHLANWLYLTGSLPELRRVWASWGQVVIYLPGGAMVEHSEYAYVVDATGRTRFVLDTDPGPASEATEGSFAVMLANAVRSVEHPS
jgi:cytochrome oxidase Cu insertion factor (SCO1/SenC/PrrC family)